MIWPNTANRCQQRVAVRNHCMVLFCFLPSLLLKPRPWWVQKLRSKQKLLNKQQFQSSIQGPCAASALQKDNSLQFFFSLFIIPFHSITKLDIDRHGAYENEWWLWIFWFSARWIIKVRPAKGAVKKSAEVECLEGDTSNAELVEEGCGLWVNGNEGFEIGWSVVICGLEFGGHFQWHNVLSMINKWI